MLEYRKNSPADFFSWMARGKTIEVRFLSDNQGNKFKNFTLIKTIANSLKCEFRFNSIFINTYEQLEKILLYKVGRFPATKIYNIFIGVNPRRKVFVKTKNKLLYKSFYGGIAGTECIQNILCDIEHKEREGSATEIMLEECIQAANFLVKELEVTDYYINISGNGVHLWLRLMEPIPLPIPDFIEFEDKLKYKLKDDPIRIWIKTYNKFVEDLNEILQKFNPKLKVDDGAKDIARIARPPGSWNVKVGKTARAVGTVSYKVNLTYILNQKFMAVIPLLTIESKKQLNKAELTSNNRYNHLNISECPLYKLLTWKLLPSILSRNHYLEQSFARILRDNNIKIEDIRKEIQEINKIQEKEVQVDPDYLDGDEIFNSETVNSYCIGSKIDLVYPLLEDVPLVQKNIIDNQRYKILNDYSWITVEKLAIHDIMIPKSYLELKDRIRKLCDKYDKTTVFFTCKLMLKENWAYYDRNKIIQQLLNKVRKREG